MKQLTPSELNHLSKEDVVAMVLQMQQQIHTLSEKLDAANARLFGRKTEKLDSMIPGQLSFNEAEAAAEEAPEEPKIETVVVRRKKQAGKREEDLRGLPTRVEDHTLSDEQLTAIYGENGWKRLPDEVYCRLEYQPAVHEVVEHHVAVYAGKKDECIVRAERPADLLRNSIATPSLVAAIMNGKYTNAMPLNRISQDMARSGVSISRGTMANWVTRCAERYLSLVYDRLQKYLCQQSVVQADETRVQVNNDGRDGIHLSWMFVFRTSELCKQRPVILYKYEKTRHSDHAAEFLDGFKGILETDAFSGYKSLDKSVDNNIRAAFCWAHARRDFADALKILKGPAKKHAKNTVAHKALLQIGAIYKAEEALKDLDAATRANRRQSEVMPLVEAYFAWIKQQNPTTIVSEKTRAGLQYSVNQEKYLRVFLEDGNVPIDNSATERAIRPFTVGRANWHVIDTTHGAQASAIVYSLVETAKANNLKIYDYLNYLLSEIPKHMDGKSRSFVDSLLPWSPTLPQECKL